MKKILYILSLLILVLFLSSCATQRRAHDYNHLRGLMLLKNTQLGRNKHIMSPKYQRTLKNNYKKIHKKR